MSTILFKVNQTDYSAHVVVGSYAVNSEELNEVYTDGAEVSHFVYLRNKIKGKFELAFASQTDYTSFLTTFNAAKTVASNSWPLTVTPNNTLTATQINARVTFKPSRTMTASRTDIIRQFSVEIEEL